jgi:hypothetical protein
MWVARAFTSTNEHSLNPNLMGIGWLRTHMMAMPISALFLPIDFGPSFPQSWEHFFDVLSASHYGRD